MNLFKNTWKLNSWRLKSKLRMTVNVLTALTALIAKKTAMTVNNALNAKTSKKMLTANAMTAMIALTAMIANQSRIFTTSTKTNQPVLSHSCTI